ncbi:MAG: DUF445 family protein, partial [Spirochaetales bacterium]
AERLNRENFRDSIRIQISRFTEDIVSAPISRLFDNQDAEPENRLFPVLSAIMSDFIDSASFRSILSSLMNSLITRVLDVPVSAVADKIEDPEKLIDRLIGRLVSEDSRNFVTLTIEELTENLRESRTRGGAYPYDGTLREIGFTSVYAFYPSILNALLSWMQLPETRKNLEVRGRKLVKSIVDRLSGLQRLFVTAGKFDKKIEESMPTIVDDIIDSVKKTGEDEVTKKNLSAVLGENLVNALLSGKNAESTSALPVLVDNLFDFLNKKETRKSLAEFFRKKFGESQYTTVREIIVRVSGTDGSDLIELLSKKLISGIIESRKSIGQAFSGMFKTAFEPFLGISLRELLNLGDERKNMLDTFIAGKVLDLLREKVPALIQSFNIYQIVVDRINSLEIESVEKLLLIVIEKHLKWINIFGGILGALIGALQVLLRVVM